MKKTLLLTLLFTSIFLNFYFYTSKQDLEQHFHNSVSALETQQENQDMIDGLVSYLKPNRTQILDYFNNFYPSDSVGPYTSQIKWRDYNFFFDYQDQKLNMITITSPPEWVCGTFSGCETNLRFKLPSFLYSSYFPKLSGFIYKSSYFLLFGIFFSILAYQILRRKTLTRKTVYFQSYFMLFFSFIFTMLTAYLWLDDVMFTDISRSLLVASWNEIEFQFLLSLIFSLILLLSGSTTERCYKSNM